MSTTRKPTAADEQDYFIARDERLGGARATECAVCHAPLPEGNRYLCAACVGESSERARQLLAGLQPRGNPRDHAGGAEDVGSTGGDADEYADCPTCGMRLDASGRCAVCVTTVRR